METAQPASLDPEPLRSGRGTGLWSLIPAAVCLWIIASLLRNLGTSYWGAAETDLTNNFYPWRVFTHRWLSQGIFPFWDMHVFSGYPTVETQQMLALNPLNLLTNLLPPGISLPILVSAHAIILVTGMWVLLRGGFRLGPAATAAGASLMVAGGLNATRYLAGHITVTATIAWWPWALYGMLLLARRTASAESVGKPRLLALTGLAHAMVITAGAPQYIAYLFWIEAVALAVATPVRRWVSLGIWSGGVWLLALLLSAPQWLPAMFYLPLSGRATSGGSEMQGAGRTDLICAALEFISPFPFGDDLRQPHLHFKNVWETATWPGTGALVFFAAAVIAVFPTLWNRRRQGNFDPPWVAAKVAFAVAALSLYMVWGGWLPGFSGFREPLKARAVLAFATAIGAAAGLHRLNVTPLKWRLSAGAIPVAAALAWAWTLTPVEQVRKLIVSFGQPFDPAANPFYYQALENPALAQKGFTSALTWSTIVLAAVTMLLLLPRRWHRQAGVLVVVIVTVEPLLQTGPIFVSRHKLKSVELPAPLQKFVQAELAAASRTASHWRIMLHPFVVNRTHLMPGFYEPRGYDPLMPYQANNRALLYGNSSAEQSTESRALLMSEVYGIRYNLGDWVTSGGEFTAPEPDPASAAAAIFTLERRVEAGAPETGRFGPRADGTHFVVPHEWGSKSVDVAALPDDFVAAVKAIPRRGGGLASDDVLIAGEEMRLSGEQGPNVWSMELNLKEPGLVVGRTTWLPGWRMQLDDQPWQPAWCANHWMIVSPVPAGHHRVTFEYRPYLWEFSLCLTVAGLLAVLALAILPTIRRAPNPYP